MKKLLVIILVILLILIGYFFVTKKISISGNISDFRLTPSNISFGSGQVPFMQEYVNRCSGLYIQNFDDRALDGGRGGLCFGVVKQEKNPFYLP